NILPIFKALEKYGDIKHEEMYEIFNMGIGMVIAVAPENAETLKKELNAFEIGKMVKRQDSAVVIKK
ncbi:MAG TPA: phosphoribosylformylglycinamidine cyclo-ligase, partial [Lactococcus lactis]|nr:phosphoribosylformylglycinamidine cyclo-ligase [Lactococcus lactis]